MRSKSKEYHCPIILCPSDLTIPYLFWHFRAEPVNLYPASADSCLRLCAKVSTLGTVANPLRARHLHHIALADEGSESTGVWIWWVGTEPSFKDISPQPANPALLQEKRGRYLEINAHQEAQVTWRPFLVILSLLLYGHPLIHFDVVPFPYGDLLFPNCLARPSIL